MVQATPKYLALVLEKARPALQRLAERFPGLIGGNLEEMIKGNIGNGVKFAGALLKGLIANGFAFINLISLILITPIVTFICCGTGIPLSVSLRGCCRKSRKRHYGKYERN